MYIALSAKTAKSAPMTLSNFSLISSSLELFKPRVSTVALELIISTRAMTRFDFPVALANVMPYYNRHFFFTILPYRNLFKMSKNDQHPGSFFYDLAHLNVYSKKQDFGDILPYCV